MRRANVLQDTQVFGALSEHLILICGFNMSTVHISRSRELEISFSHNEKVINIPIMPLGDCDAGHLLPIIWLVGVDMRS